MLYTPLDFYPPTGSKGARYIIEDKLQEFDGVNWVVVEDEDTKSAPVTAPPVAPVQAPAAPVVKKT